MTLLINVAEKKIGLFSLFSHLVPMYLVGHLQSAWSSRGTHTPQFRQGLMLQGGPSSSIMLTLEEAEGIRLSYKCPLM